MATVSRTEWRNNLNTVLANTVADDSIDPADLNKIILDLSDSLANFITITNGRDGTNGTNGYSPVIAVQNDGERRVVRITDWTGGSGAKPATGFIGQSGIVSTAAQATDIRGAAGTDGATGGQGPKGDQGDRGPAGAAGQGVAAGGNTGQILAKQSNTDFDSHWINPPSGGGGASVDDTDIPDTGTNNQSTTQAPSRRAVKAYVDQETNEKMEYVTIGASPRAVRQGDVARVGNDFYLRIGASTTANTSTDFTDTALWRPISDTDNTSDSRLPDSSASNFLIGGSSGNWINARPSVAASTLRPNLVSDDTLPSTGGSGTLAPSQRAVREAINSIPSGGGGSDGFVEIDSVHEQSVSTTGARAWADTGFDLANDGNDLYSLGINTGRSTRDFTADELRALPIRVVGQTNTGTAIGFAFGATTEVLNAIQWARTSANDLLVSTGNAAETFTVSVFKRRSAGTQGPQGDRGPQGQQGPQGNPGTDGQRGPQGPAGQPGGEGQRGPAGQGVAAGGTAGQILAKVDATDYNTHWITAPSGGGATGSRTWFASGSAVTANAGDMVVNGTAVYLARSNQSGVTTGTDFSVTANWIHLNGGGGTPPQPSGDFDFMWREGASGSPTTLADQRNGVAFNVAGRTTATGNTSLVFIVPNTQRITSIVPVVLGQQGTNDIANWTVGTEGNNRTYSSNFINSPFSWTYRITATSA